MSRFSRRHFLALTGASLTAIAGCSELTENNSQNNLRDDDSTPTASPTPTPVPPSLAVSPESVDIGWKPGNREAGKIPEENRIKAELEENETSIEQVTNWILEQQQENHRNTQKKYKTETRKLGTSQSLKQTFYPYRFFDGEQKIHAEYQKPNGETGKTEPVKINVDRPDAYVLDIRKPPKNGKELHQLTPKQIQKLPSITEEKTYLRNWKTPHGYDTHIFEQKEWKQQKKEWREELSYDKFMENPEKYGLNVEEWASRSVNENKDFRKLLHEALGAVQERNEETPRKSGGASKIGATVAQLFIEERNEKVLSGSIDTNGHGIGALHHEDWGWYVNETVDPYAAKPWKWRGEDPYFIPWSEYATKMEKREEGTYSGKKEMARLALISVAFTGEFHKDDYRIDNFLMNDEWLDTAFEQLREGEDERILAPINYELETMNDIGDQGHNEVYGGLYSNNGLEDTTMIYGEKLPELKKKTMKQEQNVPVEEALQHLQKAA